MGAISSQFSCITQCVYAIIVIIHVCFYAPLKPSTFRLGFQHLRAQQMLVHRKSCLIPVLLMVCNKYLTAVEQFKMTFPFINPPYIPQENNNSNLSLLCLFRTIWLAGEKVLHFDKFHEQESQNSFPSAGF